jgi:hypothetical protein
MVQKKTAVKTVAEPVVEPVVTKVDPLPQHVETPVVVSDVPVVDVVTVDVDKYQVVLDKLHSFVNDTKDLITVVKNLQKEYVKLQKQSSKKVKKVVASSDAAVKRSPSGFAKPTNLSDELCSFLGVPKGSAMARTLVTKHINEYIKKNNLQDPTDKRIISPDAKLKSILSIGDGDKLTYFNLQTYIKQHFKKD